MNAKQQARENFQRDIDGMRENARTMLAAAEGETGYMVRGTDSSFLLSVDGGHNLGGNALTGVVFDSSEEASEFAKRCGDVPQWADFDVHVVSRRKALIDNAEILNRSADALAAALEWAA